MPTANATGVIVADDDAMVRSVLRTSFETINLNVFVAHDGLEAVRLAARVQAALIILDLRMPQLLLLERKCRGDHSRTPAEPSQHSTHQGDTVSL